MKRWFLNCRNTLCWCLVGLGICLILLGLVSLVSSTARPSVTYAQDDEAEYIGARECNSCHSELGRSHTESRHVLTLQKASEDTVVADFSQGEDVRTVQFPGEDAARPFTLEDAAYVVGSGRYVQRFLFEADRDEYYVFPAEWNVQSQSWQPFTLAESWTDPAYNWNQNCVGCHTTGLNTRRGTWEDDGVQCEACHGPGSVHAEEADDAGDSPSDRELRNIRESIVLSPDAQVCGQCHSRGTTSDGDYAFPDEYLPGQTLANSFTLVAADDPVHWWQTGHAMMPNMQYNEWLNSAHSTALSTLKESPEAEDSCLSCHSSDYRWTQAQISAVEAEERAGDAPDALTVDTAQFGVTCTSCHNPHAENNPDFFLTTSDTYTLCTDCHQNTDEGIHHPVKEMYEGVQIVDNVEGKPSSHFTDENGPECTTCHMPEIPIESDSRATHSLKPVLVDGSEDTPPDTCTGCHADLTPDYIEQFVEGTREKTAERLQTVETSLASAADVPEWVQTVVDFVKGDGSLGIHNYAYTDALLDAVELQMGLVQITVPTSSMTQAINPADCEECHRNEFRQWASSPHANASLTNVFLRDFANQGRPGYCMNCHGSGYNPDTSSHAFEGVVCTSCHTMENGVEHPPAPVEIGKASEVCGRCHSGAHAPTYDEWLVSAHNSSGIDCVDCHTPHNNGLLLDDVNATCGSCHQEALTDPVHMGEEMDCVDCHMVRQLADDGVHVVNTGHSMLINPGVCADCHGNTHLLSVRESNSSTEQQIAEVNTLQSEIDKLKEEADEERNAGVVGGALGALIVVIILGIMWRMRSFL